MPRPLGRGFLQLPHAAVDRVQAVVPARQQAMVMALLVALARLRERDRRRRRVRQPLDVVSVSQATIASELGCRRACVARALREAERAGLVTVGAGDRIGSALPVACRFLGTEDSPSTAPKAENDRLAAYLGAIVGEDRN
jgi:hypothetical protein